MTTISKLSLAAELMKSVLVMNEEELRKEMSYLGISYEASVKKSRSFIEQLISRKRAEKAKSTEQLKDYFLSGAVVSFLTNRNEKGREEMLEAVFATVSRDQKKHLIDLIDSLRSISEEDIADIKDIIKSLDA